MGEPRLEEGWLLAWRDICRNTDRRTAIASVIPLVGAGHTLPLASTSAGARYVACLTANLDSFVLDYVVRQKLGGTHLTYHVLKQLALLPPEAYDEATPWDPQLTLMAWMVPRFVELVFTAYDLESFARDLGWQGEPFIWEAERRALIRAELDAAFLHKYGLARHEAIDVLIRSGSSGVTTSARLVSTVRSGSSLSALTLWRRQTKVASCMRLLSKPSPSDPRVAHQAKSEDE